MAYPEPDYPQPVDSSNSSLGEIIRRQRETSAHSMREFARMVGISNPYLSQIERGLREPSEQVLEAIAKSLETSADTLYEQAGMAPEGDDDEPDTIAAIKADSALTPRQRQALIQVYEAFCGQSGKRSPRRRRARQAAPPEPADRD
jgi:transcriptional regulator with XRE-family HTH domain